MIKNLKIIREVKAIALVFVLMNAVSIASACPVCIGNPDDPMTKGVSAGILFMLGILVIVFGGFAGFVFVVAKRRSHELTKETNQDQEILDEQK